MGKKSGSGYGMNNQDHISESLETILWVKILQFFDADPGWKKLDPGSFLTILLYNEEWRQLAKKNLTL
jgi:hypothetical protein